MSVSFATVAKQHATTTATATASLTTMTTMTTTDNGALSHATSGSARVDLFYGALRDVDEARFTSLLDASMAEDALHTLKLVAYVRDCRGGKGERHIGRIALKRLAATHPRALRHNLRHLVGEYGRFDDVMALMGTPVEADALELLRLQLESDVAALQAEQADAKLETDAAGDTAADSTQAGPSAPDSMSPTAKAKAATKAKPKLRGVSLCAKWIPSEKKALDKKLQMNKKLSRHMHLTPAQLRKQYLSPLRARLRILERFMCAREWDAIDLGTVPSVAMHIHGKPSNAFPRRLGDKFDAWKAGLATGETKVNAAALFPHQVVAECMTRHATDPLLEAQWQVLLDEAARAGDVSETLVLADVSGSMAGRPMHVAIALGLLVSALARDEYKHLVLTFESTPRFHEVKGASLFERVRCLQHAPWGGSTDFAAAFRAVLALAQSAGLSPAQMPRRLVVISDMQFDAADRNYETNFQVLGREFAAAGFAVPHLVFWNVNGATQDCPAYSGAANVSLVSGFSTAILKSVLAGEELTPLQTVLNVVLDARYDAITLPPAESVASGGGGEDEATHVEDDGVLL